MEIIRTSNYDAMSKQACDLIIETVQQLERPVLGLATGSTPEGLYQQLMERHENGDVSFKDVKTFNLDEYVGLASDDPNSYRYYMNNKLFHHIDLSDDQAFFCLKAM